jgi:hypothetical protein
MGNTFTKSCLPPQLGFKFGVQRPASRQRDIKGRTNFEGRKR